METYKKLLEDLLLFKNPKELADIMEDLTPFDRNRTEHLVHLTKEQLILILKRYLLAQLTKEEVEEWANAVEIREDIEFGNNDDEVTMSVIWELANPALEGPLTHESAAALIEKLSARQE